MWGLLLLLLCIYFQLSSAFLPRGAFFGDAAKVLKRYQLPQLTSDVRPVPYDVTHDGALIKHHTLLPPMLQNFETNGFTMWDIAGSAVVTDEYVRLTPTAQSRHGCLLNKIPNEFEEWSFRIGFRVSGSQKFGADGMAMWYTKNPQCTGNDGIFGSSKSFEGAGILFDTYDNDNRRDNPQVIVIGSGDDHNPHADFMPTRLSNCKFDYRKVSNVAVVHVTVKYANNQLSVSLGTFDTGMVECATAEVKLPTGFYFGVSALTGGLADKHEVFYVAVASGHPVTNDEEESRLRDGPVMESVEKLKHRPQM